MTTITPRNAARAAMAQFISDAAEAINETYWFSIRGECEASLCVHTMLTMDEYCDLLCTAELVQIGKRGPELSREKWREYLRQEELCPMDDIEHSVAEIEMGQVDLNKLKVLQQQQTKRKDLLFLRIGGYEEIGARSKPSKQFKMDISPPGFNCKLRTAQRRLRRELRGH
jgi:hypothetical protein